MSEKILINKNEELSIINIETNLASAAISLQGAQVLQWKPVGKDAVIWVSNDAKYIKGKSVRGGIPLCWPWFGFHDTEASYPIHGFARTQPWELINTQEQSDGSISLSLKLVDDLANQKFWPFKAELAAIFTIGNTLKIQLTTKNIDHQPIVIGEALHTYFKVGDIDQVKILGLDGCTYYDKVDEFKLKEQVGYIHIDREVDRVYHHPANNGEATCIIDDQSLNRRIHITKRGSQSTVVWNPWTEKSQRMGDMGNEGYRTMVCVETASALDDVVTIQPGETHSICVEYAVTNIS